MSKYAPFVRILVRYLAGAMVAKGWLDARLYADIVADPAAVGALVAGVEAGVGLIAVGFTEWIYLDARKKGGAT